MEEKLFNKLLYTAQAHGLYDKANISNAYEILKALKKKNIATNIEHLLRVSITIAKMGFNSEVIAAALLHEIHLLPNEDLFSIKSYIKSSEIFNIITLYGELDDFIENTSASIKPIDFRNQNEVFKTALYIKLADRIDVLKNNYSSAFNSSSHITQSNHFLLEIAREEGVRYLLDSLENECFRIENPDLYNSISICFNHLLRTNTRTIAQTRKAFDECFNDKNLFSNEINLIPIKYKTISYKFKARKLISIYRQLCSLGFSSDTDTDLSHYLNKYNIPLFDITLVFNDADNTLAMDSFIEFYKNMLHPLKIRIIDAPHVSDKSDSYLLLEDYCYCKYRLFLKTKTVYLKNTYGFGASANIHFRHEQMFSETEKQIIVYDNSNTPHYIERGSTALDFAFYLHPDIGYCATGAYINKSADILPLNTKLENGDFINIASDSQNKIFHASIEWFEYVNTKKSTKLLVSFFLKNH
jgi:(p)ppGpp synthase/HD superfamily hydrolase